MPDHIAIIMDGNGRWSKQNHFKHRWDGHRYGINAVRDVIKGAVEKGINTLTLFAFSRENVKRSKFEIDALINLFKQCLKREVAELVENGVRLNFVGDVRGLSAELESLAAEAAHKTKDGTKLTLNIAINYSGRWHIMEAVRAGLKANNDVSSPDMISEKVITEILAKDFGSEPDLMIRTGGEYRISNFLLWQLAYTELYFDEKLWPDYNKYDLFQAIHAFSKRQRRFGLEEAHEQFA